jgi:hypothetical protein
LTLNHTNNISLHVDKIKSSSAVGFVGGEEQLEKQNTQVQGSTAIFNINNATKSLELVKTDNPIVDGFFVQIGDVLTLPLPQKLMDGMIWTNVAPRFFWCKNKYLRGMLKTEIFFVLQI